MLDIYFEPNYGKLYEKIENGINTIFEYNSSYGKVYHTFIRREISTRVNNTVWYDSITPYGYGGPIILNCKKENKKKLVEEFKESFQDFCIENNIVSEFIRFHPIIENALDFSTMYQIENIRKTVGTNIKDYDDPVQSEFSKSCRKTIRQVLKKGVSYRIIEKPENIHNFKQIYYSTMDRNSASDYYYFDDEYFNNFLEYFREHIILVEVIYADKIIASGFYLVYGEILEAHLSGTQIEYLDLSPAYVIKYATAEWAKKNGISVIHYGGGTTNSPNDSLYKFKKKFTKETEFDFYIGKKIWNQDIYGKLVAEQFPEKLINNSSYFPLYRAQGK